jgi:hypothetical protein
MVKVFSKYKWLESANKQKEQGILSQREIDDALDIWVNEMDGKTKEELDAMGKNTYNDAYFVDA